jgi:hypothetical protein
VVSHTGDNEPKLYTQGFLKNINGVIFTQSNEIGSDEINKTEINGNYSIEQLTSLLSSTIKLQNDNNFISLRVLHASECGWHPRKSGGIYRGAIIYLLS